MSEGEKFRSPKSTADAIDASRDRAREEALREAATRPAPVAPSAPPTTTTGVVVEGEDEAPRYTSEDGKRWLGEVDAGAAEFAKDLGKPYKPLPATARAIGGPLLASCANDLPGDAADAIPWPVRWLGLGLFGVALCATWGQQFMPEPPKAAGARPQEPKSDDVR